MYDYIHLLCNSRAHVIQITNCLQSTKSQAAGGQKLATYVFIHIYVIVIYPHIIEHKHKTPTYAVRTSCNNCRRLCDTQFPHVRTQIAVITRLQSLTGSYYKL